MVVEQGTQLVIFGGEGDRNRIPQRPVGELAVVLVGRVCGRPLREGVGSSAAAGRWASALTGDGHGVTLARRHRGGSGRGRV
jgi:hypothetical protein